MKKIRLKILITLIATIISIQFYAQQKLENKICLTNQEIDYFILQDINAKSLEKDTFILSGKIKDLNFKCNLLDSLNIKSDSQIIVLNKKFNLCFNRENELKNNLDKTTKVINRQRKIIGLTGGLSTILLTLLIIL